MPIELRVLGPGDHDLLATAARGVFDDNVDQVATRELLADARHHLTVAMDGGVVIGFASAVHYVHPDKPRPELWINEVGVAPTHHRCGVGKALVGAMLEVGRQLGCTEAWVLTERANGPAIGLYESVGGAEPKDVTVLFRFSLDATHR
jgi:ribosomal protein S18 acetylase RimI-like enzyme